MTLTTSTPAPIDPLRQLALDALEGQGRAVITAPTGSGKSTRVPIWCSDAGRRVLVVEPRRLACRSLARYVARLTGERLGEGVGYAVRHDKAYTEDSKVVFATPGTVLRNIQRAGRATDDQGRLLGKWDVLVLDEFHERQIDLDLLLAFALGDAIGKLVVMSATLEVERLGDFIGAEVLRGHGRMFPVGLEHLDRPTLPLGKGIEERVVEGVRRALDHPGDALVFLPGKAEIASCRSALRGLAREHNLEVLALHGDLPPAEQDKPFEEGKTRRVILSTNVAETSVTLPGVGVVVDAGLVRQTRYHGGRGVLGLVPIAMDSAEQRRGRAGRLGPGHCIRLWGQGGKLDPRTPPEILREDLTDTALMAASCGARLQDLRFLDPPTPYAITAATDTLTRLGCIDEEGRRTTIGESVARFPLPAPSGRFLAEARNKPETVLRDAVELVAALEAGRRLLLPCSPDDMSDDRRSWRSHGCDATRLILALRFGKVRQDHLHPMALSEARRTAEQLRRQVGLKGPSTHTTVDRDALAALWMAADPHTVFVRRKRGDAFGRDGLEIQLGRDTLIQDRVDAVIAPSIFSLKEKHGRLIKIGTCAIPTTFRALARAGLGKDVIDNARIQRKTLKCDVRRVYGGRTLDTREIVPKGQTCLDGLMLCLGRGQLFRKTILQTKDRIEDWNLYRRLKRLPEPAVEFEPWLRERLEGLGIESGEDLALMMEDDVTFEWPAVMTETEQQWLTREFPKTVDLGDAAYDVSYSTAKRTVTLLQVKGKRKKAPALRYLPGWSGWKIQWQKGSAVNVLR